jgi:hypothetical protein
MRASESGRDEILLPSRSLRAKTAGARQMLTLVFYAMHDGHARRATARQHELPGRTSARPRTFLLPASASTTRAWPGGNEHVIGPARCPAGLPIPIQTVEDAEIRI